MNIARRIVATIQTKYRGFAPLACLGSPNQDILRGWRRWRWLMEQRRAGRLIEPSVRVHGDIERIHERLLIGSGACLEHGVIVWLDRFAAPGGTISLSERVYVGPYTYLGASTHRLQVGEDTMIGAHCYLITENHVTKRSDIPYARQGFVGKDVVIGRNVWLGCHVTVLAGVAIGDNAVIGAGAVVTKSVPAGEVWGGVPAKFIKPVSVSP